MLNKIIELLQREKVKTEIVKTFEDLYSRSLWLTEHPNEIRFVIEHSESDIWKAAWIQSFDNFHHIHDIFERAGIDKISGPPLVFTDELRDVLFQFMMPTFDYNRPSRPDIEDVRVINDFDFGSLYDSFVYAVKYNLLRDKTSKIFSVCEILKTEDFWGVQEPEKATNSGDEQENVTYDNESGLPKTKVEPFFEINGIRLNVSGISPNPSQARQSDPMDDFFDVREWNYLNLKVNGRMSSAACDKFTQTISKVLQCLMCSLSVLSNGFRTRVISPKWLPRSEEKIFQDNGMLIKYMLTIYFKNANLHKDTFDRRIKNAIQLLVESDTQENDAVGLALSMASIEAVLGEKGSEIAEKLSTNIAVLLEPKTENRLAAIDFVKDLYNKRSRVLHGDSIENTPEIRFQARHLAAAVLLTTVSHLDVSIRLQQCPENPSQLIKQLYDSRFTEGSIITSERYNISEYWRKEEQDGENLE